MANRNQDFLITRCFQKFVQGILGSSRIVRRAGLEKIIDGCFIGFTF